MWIPKILLAHMQTSYWHWESDTKNDAEEQTELTADPMLFFCFNKFMALLCAL